MIGAFQQLMLSASIYIICAFVLGFVYERIGTSGWRQVGFGAVMGAAIMGLELTPLEFSTFVVDIDTPLLLISTLYGGPIAAALVLPGPVLITIFAEHPDLVYELTMAVAPVLIGLTVLATWVACGWEVDRRAVLVCALLSPLTLLPSALPIEDSDVDALSVLAVWTAAGTLIFGLMLAHELKRARFSRARRKQRLFDALTGTIPAEVFQQQLEHQWRLHERYGHQYSYLMISIDDAAATREDLGMKEWERMRALVATSILHATRDSDVCTAIEYDRFGLLLPHASLPYALPVAQRVKEAVDGATLVAKPAAPVTVSIGCAEVDGTQSPGDVRAAAEGQLFLATAKGKRGVISPDPDSFSDGIVRSFPGNSGRRSDELTAAPQTESQLLTRNNHVA
ncbi:diguanylate cyclase [Stappia sp. 22II-S9-Z10]|nr:diguanylate cyclase [Stappia sp. 22II-S9-Z10]